MTPLHELRVHGRALKLIDLALRVPVVGAITARLLARAVITAPLARAARGYEHLPATFAPAPPERRADR
jgi:hypothetical protein